MSSSGTFKQDMPPPGGYKSIPFDRIVAKKVLGSKSLVLGLAGVMGVGLYFWSKNYQITKRMRIETLGGRLAVQPMIVAEAERRYLIQLRKNRDEEERLMENVPGWEVGKFMGEPIYKTITPDTWIDVTIPEYFIHADPSYAKHYYQYWKWH